MIERNTNIGEQFNLPSMDEIEGYTLVKTPDVDTITVDSDKIEITYYYAKNTAISVKYVDIDLNRELINPITIDGYVGKDYITEQKEFVGYTFKEVKGNKVGKMNLDENEIVYYYAKYVPEVNIVVHENNSQANDEVKIIVNDKQTTPSKPIAENNNIPKNNTNNNNPTKNTNNNNSTNNTNKGTLNNNANQNPIIPVANTGKNNVPILSIIGGVLVALGMMISIEYRKKTHKWFYK